jgi:hypothetical protein
MYGVIRLLHEFHVSNREPIRENDPLDRQSRYTGKKFMTWNTAKRMPKGSHGKPKRFRQVGLNTRIDAKTEDNSFPICDRFLKKKGNCFHIQKNDSKKGRAAPPSLIQQGIISAVRRNSKKI